MARSTQLQPFDRMFQLEKRAHLHNVNNPVQIEIVSALLTDLSAPQAKRSSSPASVQNGLEQARNASVLNEQSDHMTAHTLGTTKATGIEKPTTLKCQALLINPSVRQ
jgi:hypothetical protein